MIDWRIEIGRNNFKIEENDSQFERGKWEVLIADISKKILEHIEHIEIINNVELCGVQFEEFNSQDKENINTILDCIKQNQWRNLEGESRQIAKLMGEKLALNSCEYFSKWEIIGETIENCWPVYESWIKFLPIKNIINYQNEIEAYPRCDNPLELIDNHGVYGEKEYWKNILSELKACGQFISDPWLYVEKALPKYEEFLLKSSMRVRQDLIQRLGWDEWLLWVSNFPLIYLKQAAIFNIDDLDIITKLVAQVSNMEKIESANKMILIVLLIKRYLAIGEIIQRNLHYAISRVELDTGKVDYREKLKKWEEDESYERINSILDEINFEMMLSIFNHLKVENEKKHVILNKLRDLLITKIAKKCETSDCYKKLLLELDTQTKLLNATILFFCLKDNQEFIQELSKLIFDGYVKLLISEKFFWHGNFNYESDEGKLLWYLAGVFSHRSDPYKILNSIVEKVLINEGGWKYSYDEYLKSITKVTHCLIVGTMMAEWMNKNENIEEAHNLYAFIWELTHKWIRGIFDDRNEKVTALLISLWARLFYLYPDNYIDMSLGALDDIDSLKHQITCLKVLKQNLRNKDQNAKLPQELQEKICLLFSESIAVEKESIRDSNEIRWFNNSILELAPNIKAK